MVDESISFLFCHIEVVLLVTVITKIWLCIFIKLSFIFTLCFSSEAGYVVWSNFMLPSYIFQKILEIYICDTSSERLELLNQILFIKWMLNFLMFVMVCLSDAIIFHLL